MRDLHEQLRNLVSQHGTGIAENAEQFRAALDDYLTEADASQGELNLLVDAVRLGGVERLLAMLDNGADPDAAVREAGGELARDRSSDEQRSRWAVAAMGYALGRVDAGTVRSQLEGDVTRLPFGATAPAAPPAAPVQSPIQSPPSQPPAQSPAWPSAHPLHPSPQPAYAAAPPRKSRTGLIAGLVVLAVVVIGGGVGLALALGNGDSEPNDNNKGGGDTTQACADGCVEGSGYTYELPDGWTDVTDSFDETEAAGASLDTASAWGETIDTSRANVIIEISPWTYTDLDDAQERLTQNLEQSLTDPTSEEIDGRSFDGEEAVGLRITSTNANGIEVEQTAYLMQRNDDAVVIYASNEASDDATQDPYEEIYDSWSWD